MRRPYWAGAFLYLAKKPRPRAADSYSSIFNKLRVVKPDAVQAHAEFSIAWFAFADLISGRYGIVLARLDFREENIHGKQLLAMIQNYRLLFGHRYVTDIGDINGSSQFVFEGRWVINPLWEVGGYIRWNSSNLGLQEWQLSATRDQAARRTINIPANLKVDFKIG